MSFVRRFQFIKVRDWCSLSLLCLSVAGMGLAMYPAVDTLESAGLPQEQDATELRTWTDRSGKFSTRAELVRVDGEIAELRKDDGTLVKIPLERLSDVDQSFVRNWAGKPEEGSGSTKSSKGQAQTLASIKASEQKLLYAKKIIDFYRNFLSQPDITDSDRIAAERRLAELEPEASRDALLIGKEFKRFDEIAASKNESNQAIDTLVNGPPGKDGKEVLKLLKGLARKDPVSCRANFLLGMGFAITARNDDLSIDEFQECLRRLEDFGALAAPAPEQALSAMYNNLALIQIRRGYLDAALKSWEAAAAVNSNTLPEPLQQNFIHQVILINAAIASDGTKYFSNPEPKTVGRYRKFAETIGLTEDRIRAHRQHGWQYLSLQQLGQDEDLKKMRVSMVDEACLSCRGSSVVQCKKCGGDGVVLGKVFESRRLPTGQEEIIATSVNRRCEFCERGTFPCRSCHNGTEEMPR